MKIYEKINLLIEKNAFNLSALHRQIKELFEENAIAYLTLYRTVHGLTKVRESTLFQIACALKTTPEEIKKNTDAEAKINRYDYNKKAYLEVTDNSLDFLPARLVLLPGAKTQTEQDPIEKGNFVKWIFGLQGEMTCVVMTDKGLEKQIIVKNQSFSFRSTLPHYFENNSIQKTVSLLIQYPKYI